MQKDVKSNIKKEAAIVTQLDLMGKAHKRLLELLRGGTFTLFMFEKKCKKGSINRSEEGPIRDMIRATMAARLKIMENFFEICKSKKPLPVAIDNKVLENKMGVRPSNMKCAMGTYRREYRRVVLEIRKIIKQGI